MMQVAEGMSGIELVVFDLAGTTVRDNDAVAAAFVGALFAAGVPVEPAAVQAVMGLSKPAAIRVLLSEHRGDPSENEVAAIHDNFLRRMQRHYETDIDVGPIPGAEEVFARLRAAGVRVALDTGFSRPIVEPLLARLGWSIPETIDAVITSDEVERGRPHPDMIRALMERLGVSDPLCVAKVGDTWADLEEGSQAGCGLNIGVCTGSYPWEKLVERPHTHILSSVADLPELLLARV